MEMTNYTCFSKANTCEIYMELWIQIIPSISHKVAVCHMVTNETILQLLPQIVTCYWELRIWQPQKNVALYLCFFPSHAEILSFT